MTAVVPDSIISLKVGEENNKNIHSIPCKLDYTGSAKVNEYFFQNTVGEGEFQATFRGRGLHGKLLRLPVGYELNVLKPRGCKKIFTIESHTKSYVHWEWDREVGEQSPIARALAHLEVAAALASD